MGEALNDFTLDRSESQLSETLMVAELERLTREVAHLTAFKEYVHKRLDGMSVPTDPVPEFTASTGCRIGTRLDWIIALHAGLVTERNEWREVANERRNQISEQAATIEELRRSTADLTQERDRAQSERDQARRYNGILLEGQQAMALRVADAVNAAWRERYGDDFVDSVVTLDTAGIVDEVLRRG